MKPAPSLAVAWGPDEFIVISAFRYALGRRTYIVGDTVDWLIANWPAFRLTTRAQIRKELDQAFDDAAAGRVYVLGADMDREDWLKLWEFAKWAKQ